MGDGYAKHSLDSADTNDEKPGSRWELSAGFALPGYSYNVAVLGSGSRLSENAHHENQSELFHVIEGRCRVEIERESFDLGVDELVHFEPGIAHLLHNPLEAACKLVAVGAPADGRYPVEQVQSYSELLAERYPDRDVAEPNTEV